MRFEIICQKIYLVHEFEKSNRKKTHRILTNCEKWIKKFRERKINRRSNANSSIIDWLNNKFIWINLWKFKIVLQIQFGEFNRNLNKKGFFGENIKRFTTHSANENREKFLFFFR